MKPLIVHISADYPDACEPRKTRAIAALVEGTSDVFDHRVYSLNRDGSGLRAVMRSGAVTEIADCGTIASWRYAAPGKGMFLARSMAGVADAILADIERRKLPVSLVQGHKLSFEGIAARRVARRLGVPYALTLQGNTDQKVLVARRDLRRLYGQIWHDAAAVFAFAPWIARWCEQTLGERNKSSLALPCIPVADAILPPVPTAPKVVTAFHLEHWRNKNIEGVVRACVMLRQSYPDLTLEIAGGGSTAAERAVDRVLEHGGARNFARRIGAIDGQSIQQWMNGAAVLALPSKRESFGMVYIEALLAGCPIIYTRGAAVDGYFDENSFAVAVNAAKVEEIAAGIGRILNDAAACKADLSVWQANSAAAFRRDNILRHYAQTVTQALI